MHNLCSVGGSRACMHVDMSVAGSGKSFNCGGPPPTWVFKNFIMHERLCMPTAIVKVATSACTISFLTARVQVPGKK